MFTLCLSSKDDVHRLTERLRVICDQEGIRLGKGRERPEKIIAELLGTANYNTLLGIAESTKSA